MSIPSEQIQALKAADRIIEEMKTIRRNGQCGRAIFTWKEFDALLAERDADKALIAELRNDVDAANARVDAGCAQLCSQDEEIATLRQCITELEESKTNLAILYDANLCDMLTGVEYMDPPDGGQVEPIEQVSRMVADYRQKIAEQAKRIAELEARTLTVNLPLESLPKTEAFWSVMYDLMYQTKRKPHENWNVSLAFSEAKELAAYLNEVMPFRDAAGITLVVEE